MKTATNTKPNMPFHKYLESQIAICGKQQNEISHEMGYTKPNIITMFKKGLTKVPISKIKPLANSIGVDPLYLLRLAMVEYMPDSWAAIEEIVGHTASENEREMLDIIREITGDTDPALRTAEQKKLLKQFARSLNKGV